MKKNIFLLLILVLSACTNKESRVENYAIDFVQHRTTSEIKKVEVVECDSIISPLMITFMSVECAEEATKFLKACSDYYSYGKKISDEVYDAYERKLNKKVNLLIAFSQHLEYPNIDPYSITSVDEPLYHPLKRIEKRQAYKVTIKFNGREDFVMRVLIDKDGETPYSSDVEIMKKIEDECDSYHIDWDFYLNMRYN